jgi:hypothetical protein
MKNKHSNYLSIAVAMILWSSQVMAAQSDTAKSQKSIPMKMLKFTAGIVIGEGLVIGLGMLAREYPKYMGVCFTGCFVMPPAKPLSKYSDVANYAASAEFIGLGLYNIFDAGRNDRARKRRLLITVAGIHAIGLSALVAEKLFPNKNKNDTVSYGLSVGPKNAFVSITRRF